MKFRIKVAKLFVETEFKMNLRNVTMKTLTAMMAVLRPALLRQISNAPDSQASAHNVEIL